MRSLALPAVRHPPHQHREALRLPVPPPFRRLPRAGRVEGVVDRGRIRSYNDAMRHPRPERSRTPSGLRVNRPAVRSAARRHGLDLVILFGSRARGIDRPGSDADVAFLTTGGGRRGFGTRQEGELTESVARALHAPEGVDLVDIRRASSLLQYEVARDGIVLYERKPGIFGRFRLYAARRFDDDAPFRAARSRYLRRRCG